MAEIIVLTAEAQRVLSSLLFRRINDLLGAPDGSKNAIELKECHKIYADVVGKEF